MTPALFVTLTSGAALIHPLRSPARRSRLPRWATVLASIFSVAALAAALAVPATAASAEAPGSGTAPVPVLSWHACDDGFQCATARVPLDYRHPHGATISIAVMRHLATDPAHSADSLFFNGGGPSEQLASFLSIYQRFPAALKERFTVVSFDPRGFGESTAIRCFPSEAAEQSFLAALPPFPVGSSQDRAWEQTYAAFDKLCAARNGALLDHDTTADVARDMNLLRQAMGDPVLNYLGLSYGTALGVTYANLFPSRVGKMVLDANVNPEAWSSRDGSLPVLLRLGAGQASAASMTAFLNMCGQTTTAACAFSAGSLAATRAKWTTLLRRLSQHTVTIGDPPLTYTYAYVFTSMPLEQVSDWQAAASLLQELWTASSAGNESARLQVTDTVTSSVYTGVEQNLAVLCSDTSGPRSAASYQAIAKQASTRWSGFGLQWAWATEACADWPGSSQDRYTGPWNRPTASTILLIGNTGDPALPYQDSLAMSRELARARLLTVDGYGHTEAANPSTCALNYEISYLLTGALPVAGTTCHENATPFPAP
jgi:pimeloyl-ACP methyl ester carboxylesterase